KCSFNYSDRYKDSVTYMSAFSHIVSSNCNKATAAMKDYLTKYERGIYRIDANYHIGECYYNDKKLEDALPYFLAVLEQPRENYLEKALYRTATIYYLKKDYKEAMPYYARLEKAATADDMLLISYFGQMRCNNESGNRDQTIEACKKLIA